MCASYQSVKYMLMNPGGGDDSSRKKGVGVRMLPMEELWPSRCSPVRTGYSRSKDPSEDQWRHHIYLLISCLKCEIFSFPGSYG